MDLCEIWFWALSKKSVEFQVWLKSGRNIGCLHEDPCCFTVAGDIKSP